MNPHRRVMPALVGGLIVAGAVGGFIATRAAANDPSGAQLQSAAGAAATIVSTRLDADAQLLSAAAAAVGGDPSQTPEALATELRRVALPDRAIGVARASRGATSAVVIATAGSTATTLEGVDVTRLPKAALVLELAGDRGSAGAVVTTGPDGQPTVLDVQPLYGASGVPSDIASRRAALNGFVITVTPIAALVTLPASASTEISVRVSDGAQVLGATGRGKRDVPPTSATALAVTSNGVAWTVQAWPTPTSSALPWFVLGGGLFLAAVAAALVMSRERSIAAAVAEAGARNQELALVARTGPMLQQSLALGDLLPVFVVEIGDELGLDGTSISLVDDSGDLVRVFSLGATAAATPTPNIDSLPEVPESVAPGAYLTLPLQRVGRVVGAFEARAVRGISPSQMETLQAVCALLAAAIGNVRLFQDEQDMVARLREVDKMKTSFIGSVSHELRTSVTAIQGFAGLLEGDGTNIDAQRHADYVERIGRNARSLGVLVEDLLDFARFERAGLTAPLRPIDLSDLVPKVVEQMSAVLGERPVSLDIEPEVIATADTLAIERVMANLLSNAGKYTPPGSEISVGLHRRDGHAVLSVCDHGPGVPVGEREKVFELFYRSEDSARVTRGVGIGLALTRQLVLHLNGSIEVDDAPGGGARFRVTIPLADDPSPGFAVRSESAPRGARG